MLVELKLLQRAADVAFVTPVGIDFDKPNLVAVDQLVSPGRCYIGRV
jgi:hypothetical protein